MNCLIVTGVLYRTLKCKPDIKNIILKPMTSSIIMGIGNGCFQSPSNTAIMTSVRTEEIGIASGILSLSRNMGNILGVAITITLFENFRNLFLTSGHETAFLNAYHLTMAFGIIFGAVCLTCATIAYAKQ